MSALLLAPLGLALLAAAWCAIQRAWLVSMERPSAEDALARGGCGGQVCACESGATLEACAVAAATGAGGLRADPGPRHREVR